VAGVPRRADPSDYGSGLRAGIGHPPSNRALVWTEPYRDVGAYQTARPAHTNQRPHACWAWEYSDARAGERAKPEPRNAERCCCGTDGAFVASHQYRNPIGTDKLSDADLAQWLIPRVLPCIWSGIDDYTTMPRTNGFVTW
jgi:hypothetical protein